jgi:hypothetical protein
MNMTNISKCSMSTCAYNKDNSCRTPGITVGPHAECNTYVHASSRGGFDDVKSGVGACTASSCKFNESLECKAGKVDITVDEKHADCKTFAKK